MNQPVQLKTPTGTANGSGTSYSRGKVLGIAGVIAQVQLPTGEVVQVRTDFLRGKSGPPLAGEIWILDQLYGQWMFAVPVGIVGGGGALSALTDVVLTSPSNGQALVYDSALTKWKNAVPTAAAVPYKSFLGIAERALAFLSYQTKPFLGVSAAADSTVVLSRPYPFTFTGIVSGYFDAGSYTPSGTVTATLVLCTNTAVTSSAATATVASDGSFSFGSAARNGFKSVRITDSNGTIADSTKSPGTLRSIYAPFSGGANGTQPALTGKNDTVTYAYDQAVAMLAALAMGRLELAQRLYGGLWRQEIPYSATNWGSWPVMTEQLTPDTFSNVFRLDAQGMALYAVGAYGSAASFGDEIFGYPWTTSLSGFGLTPFTQGGTGLYQFGSGTYPVNTAGYAPIGSEQSASAYTADGNMMAWLGITKARQLIQAGPIGTATDLQVAIMASLWNAGQNRFNRDLANSTADPLRNRILGYFFLRGIGRSEAPNLITDAALTPYKHTSPYSGAKGYSAYRTQAEYPNASYPIWTEGTLLLALAFLVSGDTSRWAQTISDLFIVSTGVDDQRENGGPTANVGIYFRDVQRIQSTLGGIPYILPDSSTAFDYPNTNTFSWSTASAAAAIFAITGGGIFGI